MNEPERNTPEPSIPPNNDTSHSETHNSDNSNNNSNSNTPSPFGKALAKLSDSMNENLILARYTTMATVGILAAYGLAHTPLFFRYRTVSELPAHYFTKRRTIHCRLVQRVPSSNNAILCQVRHLSPIERILSKSCLDWFMRMHPAAAVLGTRRDLLTVQLAAVVAPPNNVDDIMMRWEQLVRQRTYVRCQLVARQVRRKDAVERKKRTLDLDELELYDNDDDDDDDSEEDQVAIVKMYYRPKLQLVDIGESMVRYGRASPCADGLYPPAARIRDASDAVRDLRSDSAYTDRIARAEFEAAKASYGMWSDPRIRQARADVVEEVEFQTKAPWWRKLFRWIRGD